MPHDLIGYLTGAIDPHQRDVIDEALRTDPVLHRELVDLQDRLLPLEEIAVSEDPIPPDLIRKTWETIDQSGSVARVPGDATKTGTTERGSKKPGSTKLGDSTSAPSQRKVRLSEQSSTPPRSHRSLDVAAAALTAAVVLAIALPTLIQYRSHARQILCGDHLRQFGTALVQFANRHPTRQLPAIDDRGARAFAGMYAVRLSDAGLLPDQHIRWCPVQSVSSNDPVPTLTQMQSADVNQLVAMQRTAGGHYAYNLGVQSDAGYQPPIYQARTAFAVLGDLPPPMSDGHRGSLNVLYEDGSVRMVSNQTVDALPDHPFQNHNHRPEAGVTIDDASLAPSWRPPFISSLQR